MRRKLLLLAVLGALAAAPTQAAVSEARLHVKGLACPFCTYGIEKNLKKVIGVMVVETTIRTGLVRAQLAPDAEIDLEALQKAVAKSGFTLDHIEVTATGRVVQRDGRPALETSPGKQAFLLVDAMADTGELSAEALAMLNQASGNGAHPVTVSGRVHTHDGMPPALSVENVEMAQR